MANRVGGIIFFKVNGELQQAKGDFTYNLGKPKRDGITDSSGGTVGFKETAQVPFIEGEITDHSGLDLASFVELDGVTATLELGNGKVISLREAWYAGEGTGNTGEGNIGVRFEGKSADEIA
ncbi:MAG: phage tail tube protein [Desulfovibrionaceae bacterium]